jgi:protease IV
MNDNANIPPDFERKIIRELSLGSLQEKKRSRRWGIFFKLWGLGLATALVLMFTGFFDKSGSASHSSSQHTAVVELSGVIDSGGTASAESINGALQAAFKDSSTAAVLLKINSPGGSPVQAGMIYDEILRLRKLHPKTPIYAVIEEICASGGYYVAAATDKIFVDKASLVGSIGVLMDGFGFTGLMEKLGVERRLLTAGENKGFLDPFSPQNDTQRKFVQTMLAEIHQQFIDAVKNGRGKRLKESPEMFTGLIWSGAKSIELGLADAQGTMDSVAREVVKVENMIDFTSRENIIDRFARRIGTSAGDAVLRSVRSGASLR